MMRGEGKGKKLIPSAQHVPKFAFFLGDHCKLCYFSISTKR